MCEVDGVPAATSRAVQLDGVPAATSRAVQLDGVPTIQLRRQHANPWIAVAIQLRRQHANLLRRRKQYMKHEPEIRRKIELETGEPAAEEAKVNRFLKTKVRNVACAFSRRHSSIVHLHDPVQILQCGARSKKKKQIYDRPECK